MMKRSSKAFLGEKENEFGSACWYVKTGLDRPENWWEMSATEKMEMSLKKAKGKVRANLRVTDCNSTINISFFAATEEEVTERLDKLDTFIKELTDFRRAYTEVYADSFVEEDGDE